MYRMYRMYRMNAMYRMYQMNGMKHMYRMLFATVALAFLSVTASASTITVGASGCDDTSINAAISAASGGDVIHLSAETYFQGEQRTVAPGLGFASVLCQTKALDKTP